MYIFHNCAIESVLGLELKTSIQDLCLETKTKTLVLVFRPRLKTKTKTFINRTRVLSRFETLVSRSLDWILYRH